MKKSELITIARQIGKDELTDLILEEIKRLKVSKRLSSSESRALEALASLLVRTET